MITSDALHKKTPQEITALLYEALFNQLEEAVTAIEHKNMMSANDHLKKASDIITRLGAGINYEAGIIADQLDALYAYMADAVVTANYQKNVKQIKEIQGILQQIQKAWFAASKKNSDIQPKAMKTRVSAYEKNTMFE